MSTTAMVAPRLPPVKEPMTKAVPTRKTYAAEILSTFSVVNFIVNTGNKRSKDLSNYESFSQSQDLTKITHPLFSVSHWLGQTRLVRAV